MAYIKQIYTAFIRVSGLKLWSLCDCNCAIMRPSAKQHNLQSPRAHSFNQSLSWPYIFVYYEMLLSQLGPKPTRPKPSRPKTNSAQNQVGPKPTRPKTHSALDSEILLLSSSLSSFLFLPSFVLCTGNLFHLKECQSRKSGNLERCNFQTVTVMWI